MDQEKKNQNTANYLYAHKMMIDEILKMEKDENKILEAIKNFYIIGQDYEQPQYSKFANEIESMDITNKFIVLKDLCSDILKIDYACSVKYEKLPDFANKFYRVLQKINSL